PRQWVAVMFMNALTDALTYDTIIPTTFNSLLTGNNYGTYTTMGWKYFGLYDWEGIIVANEYADLHSDEALSSENTKIVDGDDEYKFKNWTTDLTEIGEYRRGWAVEDGSKDKVVYVTDDGVNTEFSCGGDVTIKKSNIDGIKLNDDTVYYKNFEDTKAYKSESAVAKGNWLRVVDNDDDGTAEFVFVTEFTMDTVSKKTSSKLTLSTVAATEDFATESELAKGDVVVYTYIDGTYYVEAAESFAGEVDKYTYKNKTLTVDGEDYDETEIALSTTIKADYNTELEYALKETEYTYYLDFFGNIGAYSLDEADAGEFVLLTDAYYETNRNGKVAAVDAYLDGEIQDVDVKRSSSTDWASFIETESSNNAWEKLIEWKKDPKAGTNVARYTMDDEGVMSLYTAQTVKYNKKGIAYDVITDYVDLHNGQDIEAGQRTFIGNYELPTFDAEGKITGKTTIQNAKVQANKDTVYYYVSYATGYPVVETVTGYKNSYDVSNVLKANEIYAVYAVATSVDSEAEDKDSNTADKEYWVADVIVIETEYPVFAQDSQMVLGYNVVNKTYSDYAALDVITAEGAKDELDVIFYDGLDYDEFSREEDIAVLEFYYATTDEDGMSYIRTVTDYDNAGIYAGKLNRVTDLGKEYVVTVDGIELYYDEASVVVYDIAKGTRANSASTTDDDDETLTLSKGKTYIFVGDINAAKTEGEIIYAILVNDTFTEILYDKVVGNNSYTAVQSQAIADIKKAFADAGISSDDLAEDKTAVGGDYGALTLADIWTTWTGLIADAAETDIAGIVDSAKTQVPTVAELYKTAVKTPVKAAAAEAVAAITSVEVEDGKWATVKAAIIEAIDAVKNVSDVTVATTDYTPVAAGGVGVKTFDITYKVAGDTVELKGETAKTITIYVD
ncbi:MAG: hypothetical protein IJA56_01270, partial [Clostridia bacterium]|nr:hypothetical protein [Clostridia bacterium]